MIDKIKDMIGGAVAGLEIFGVLAIAIGPAILYLMNLYKLICCDFEGPWKEEVIRSIGAIIPLVGMVAGLINF